MQILNTNLANNVTETSDVPADFTPDNYIEPEPNPCEDYNELKKKRYRLNHKIIEEHYCDACNPPRHLEKHIIEIQMNEETQNEYDKLTELMAILKAQCSENPKQHVTDDECDCYRDIHQKHEVVFEYYKIHYAYQYTYNEEVGLFEREGISGDIKEPCNDYSDPCKKERELEERSIQQDKEEREKIIQENREAQGSWNKPSKPKKKEPVIDKRFFIPDLNN